MTKRLIKQTIHTASVGVLAVLGLASLGMGTNQIKGVRFRPTFLVSNQPRVALLQDTNLVNSWGVSFSPTGPFWVSDNGTGLATLYTVTNGPSGKAHGKVHVVKNPLEVHIPGDGTPTGQVFNDTPGFGSNLFLFASEDGTISGWRPALGTNAEALVSNTNAVYKGLTLATNSSGPVLLAANFRAATVDMYDTNLNLVGQFADSSAPAGFAPFNVQLREGLVFVTFALQDTNRHDDVAGPGNGLIDTFDPNTGTFQRFATGSNAGGQIQQLNSPWGVAIAPSGFADRAGQVLVGNFGDGTIMAFDTHGQFLGLLPGNNGQPLTIDGLWALTFGNGGQAGALDTLFFSAGPNNEMNGLFGSINPVGGSGKGNRGHKH